MSFQLNKPTLAGFYQFISVTFCVVVVMSNVISAKMIKLPMADFNIPAGLITYPLTFLLSDLVTEIFGAKKARLMVYMAFAMNLVGFGMIQLALLLPTANEVGQIAFTSVMGLSGLRIFSSLIAYLSAQIVDIQVYALIKKWTGSRFLWLRNNGSTCIAQIVDTVMIDMIYLGWGLNMSFNEVLPIMLISYLYKTTFSFANTPLFYMCVFLVKANWKLPTFKGAQEAFYESKL